MEEKYTHIPKEKFQFAQFDEKLHDKKLDTKPISYFKDAFLRFRRNKSSVIASFIILFLFLFAIFVPILFNNSYSADVKDTYYLYYDKLLPKSKLFAWAGWNGCYERTVDKDTYLMIGAIEAETGYNAIVKVKKEAYIDFSNPTTTYYDIVEDSYYGKGMLELSLSAEEYKAIIAYQDEHNVQILYPAVNYRALTAAQRRVAEKNANIWYKCNEKGAPIMTADGQYQANYLTEGEDRHYNSLRIEGDDGSYKYASRSGIPLRDENGNTYLDEDGEIAGSWSYKVRLFRYTYFQYRYGFEPCFRFGTNGLGQDVLTRLGQGARFSFVLAIFVSMINLSIGALYGAIEGYYGGATDLIMERIRDVLGGIPFMVVTTLFQLYLQKAVGVVGALLFAFVFVGWLGMAGTVRMQFYRFKHQEYILSARTLGAKDFRLMFKHIFPNALGTIITSCVLVIPGVIFSESSLTYLGIINLEASQWTSVGTMLALGKDYLSNYPHILLFPSIFISLLMISFNLFGNGLRDAFNPSLRGSEG